jgi:hypothetical protein
MAAGRSPPDHWAHRLESIVEQLLQHRGVSGELGCLEGRSASRSCSVGVCPAIRSYPPGNDDVLRSCDHQQRSGAAPAGQLLFELWSGDVEEMC